MTKVFPMISMVRLFAALAALSALPATALALGGKSSAPAGGRLKSHSVMVLGSKGSACTGTLVAQDVVLTAGHCAQGSKQLAIAWFNGGEAILETVSAIESHPQYSGGNLRSIDIALVRLARPLPSSYAPVNLASTGVDTPAGNSYTLAGFGLQTPRDEASAGKLRAASVEALPLSTSRVLHLGMDEPSKELQDAHLQVCKGDSGGPVFTDGDATLAGVIFATYNSNVKPGARWLAICGNTAQAIQIGPQRDWIDGVLAKWR